MQRKGDDYEALPVSDLELAQAEAISKKVDGSVQGLGATARPRSQTAYFAVLATCSIISALGFSTLQEKVFNIPGFQYAGWMTFITYVTFSLCGWVEALATRSLTRHVGLRDYLNVSLLAMGGTYCTNWALEYLNYTTRLVFKSCRIIPVMAFRTLVVGQRYNASQYGAGLMLVVGICLFTAGDAEGLPNFHPAGIALISLALVCDALTANLEERQFFRIRHPASHSEVMIYLSMCVAAESFVVLCVTGELRRAVAHSLVHPETVPIICAFSMLGYVTVCLVLLIIKNFGATNAEVVKSMRKVCQVVLSFVVFPKPLSWKYVAGGLIVAAALYGLQRTGKKPPPAPGLGPLPDLAPLASLGGGGGGGVDGDREHARGGGGMGAVG